MPAVTLIDRNLLAVPFDSDHNRYSRRRVSEFGAFNVKRAPALKAKQVRPVHAACVSEPSCRESRAGSKLSQLHGGAGV
jgi:hypothetical protein